MKINGSNLPDSVRAYFTRRGYHLLREEPAPFGGIILYLRSARGAEAVAYYLTKRPSLEIVSSDELRRALNFVRPRLRYVVTTSRFSAGAYQLAAEEGIIAKAL